MSEPLGWTRQRVRDLILHHASGPSPTCEERNITSPEEWGLLKTTAVTWAGWDATAHKVPPSYFWGNRALEVHPGDVLITKAGPRDRCGVTVYVLDTLPHLMVSGKMILLRPDQTKTNAVVLASALATNESQRFLDSRTTGMADAQLNFTNQLLLDMEINMPPLLEQRRIAEILSTVDEAIEQTEALIAKYRQIKAGLMYDLFTRGVTSDGHLRPPRAQAPHLYKDSPVGWIPKEWTFGSLCEFLTGGPKNGYSPQEVNEWSGFYALGLGCLTTEGFKPHHLKMVAGGTSANRDVLLVEGDLLLSRSNTRDLVGLCGIYRDIGSPCIYPDLMMRLRPNSRTSGRFLETLLLSPLMRLRITGAAVGTSGSMVKLNSRSVLRLELSMPDKGEQTQILKIIHAQMEAVDSLKRDLEKLRQQKHGLMHDLLTGRVRVKVAAI